MPGHEPPDERGAQGDRDRGDQGGAVLVHGQMFPGDCPGLAPCLHSARMFDSCVLGVDPGLASLGLAVVARRDRRPELLWSGTVRTDPADREERRLAAIHRAVRSAIDEHGASALAVERVAWNRNVTSGLQVARATGVVLLAAADAGIEVAEYGPLEVKMAITGVGNARKQQVHAALAGAHGLERVPDQPDAADAVAVAVCHVTQARLRRASERAAVR